MPDDRGRQEELLRSFQAQLSGMDLSDLRRMVADLSLVSGETARQAARPELRRPPRDETALYRVRVDLDGAAPPIWRRLHLRSDLPLDVVHQVLQVAFDWTDSHLHRFSLGGSPFSATSQLFLCPFDVEEADDAERGVPEREVRLDEVLQEPGDVLHYVYDYGDSWELTVRLEEVRDAPPGAPSAVAVGGRRAAPPEDSGGGTDLASLALGVDDPERFDLDEPNEALRAPFVLLREQGVDRRLVDLVHRLHHTRVGDDLTSRVLSLAAAQDEPDADAAGAALAAHRWFLDRAAAGGIELTAAGYLQPADVVAASELVPAMAGWIGTRNRESHTYPMLEFRESLRRTGLLRRSKGTLLLTRAGAAAQRDPGCLWSHLAARLAPTAEGGLEVEATLLLLAYAATSPDGPFPRQQVATALAELGWQDQTGGAPSPWAVDDLPAAATLRNVGGRPAQLGGEDRVSPAAAALARAALLRGPARDGGAARARRAARRGGGP